MVWLKRKVELSSSTTRTGNSFPSFCSFYGLLKVHYQGIWQLHDVFCSSPYSRLSGSLSDAYPPLSASISSSASLGRNDRMDVWSFIQ